MAKINLTPEEYADLTISFLLDVLLNKEEITIKNENFDIIVDIFDKKGLKPFLLKYYMNMSSNDRINYKRIKNVFTDIDFVADIKITSKKEDKEDEEKKKGLLRKALDIAKKLIKKESVTKKEINILSEAIENLEEENNG